MNEQKILDMAKPFVRDGCLTYKQFEIIYDMLPLREQYMVVEILFCHDIALIDAKDDEEVLQLGSDDTVETEEYFEELK